MKRLASSLLIATFCLFLFACGKTVHSVRFQNSFSQSVENVVAGTAQIGTVRPGELTSYKEITPGNFTISGNTSTGGVLNGAGSIQGKGEHFWTIMLSSSGQLSIVHDEK